MAKLLKNVLQKEDVIDSLLDVLEKGNEILGNIFPIASIAPFVRLGLDYKESQETQYRNEQFQKVRGRLCEIANGINQMKLEIEKFKINIRYIEVENNLTNQFRMFMDIFNAEPEYRELRKNLFLDDFWTTGGDENLFTLYNGVTGNNFCEKPMLEDILDCEQKSLRQVEQFCTKLKQLFNIGLIALLGCTVLEGRDVKKVLEDWEKKMKVVQSKIDEAIECCINSFLTQAKLDAEGIVSERSDKNNQELADMLMDHLKTKYNWVSWSVRVFNSPTYWFIKEKDYQGLMGKSCFQVPSSDEKLNVVISYSTSPKPIDKALILTLMMVLQQYRCIYLKPSMTLMARQLFMTIPFCVVHTIKSSCKDLGFSYNFSEELHCSVKFKDFNVFFHSA